jgi:hypothetical protein
MKTIIIYLDAAKEYSKCKHVIRLDESKFKSDVAGLVEYITKSDRKQRIQNYHSYEVI